MASIFFRKMISKSSRNLRPCSLWKKD